MEETSIKDKVIGKTKEAFGRVQKAAGDLTGDAGLKAKGEKTEALGKAQGKPQGFLDKVKNTVKDIVGIAKYTYAEATNYDEPPFYPHFK
jgi:uncharacterized protein YjbJ (UPF0337 family)